jgi:hypothetical protein
MPTIKSVPVQNLSVDLENYRTVPQRNEGAAMHAMIAINADWFWALAESLLDSGYLPTENIIVLKGPRTDPRLVVKEGNRRIAILKMALGHVPVSKFQVPPHLQQKIDVLTPQWKKANASVPCSVYPASEVATVDRIVTLAHGKGEKAGRDPWEAVARARHNRDQHKLAEPALDLLESYLKHGQNLTQHQKDRWAGVYPLSVLEEAVKRLSPRFGAANSRDFAKLYPNKITHRDAVEQILYQIGLGSLGFDKIRNKAEDFADAYPCPAVEAPTYSARRIRRQCPGLFSTASAPTRRGRSRRRRFGATPRRSNSRTTSHSGPFTSTAIRSRRLKAAYYRLTSVPPDGDIAARLPNQARSPRALAEDQIRLLLNLRVPVGHHLTGWATLVIETRRNHVLAALQVADETALWTHAQNAARHWSESLRYHANKPYDQELEDVAAAARWLKRTYRTLWS